MSEIHVQQIKANLANWFAGCIDLSDVEHASAEQREATFNCRALAAFAPYHFDDLSTSAAGACVTDGTRDNGVDSLRYISADKTLLLAQSKWSEDGRGSIEIGDLHKFFTGFRDLVNLRYDRFNSKFNPHHHDIKGAVEDANGLFKLVLVTTGQDDLSAQAKALVADFLKEMNDPTEILTFLHLKQGDVHSIIARNVRGNPINVDVQLFEWGMTREPFVSYYGQVDASELARWYKDHHNRLFDPNLRLFLGTTDANIAMIETATHNPQNFWYFNNGVTAVCDTIRKKPLGGSSRESGTFQCENLRVVNGAQTIGSLGNAHTRDPNAVARTRVLTRFISLEHCPPDFARAITKGKKMRLEGREVFIPVHGNRLLSHLVFRRLDLTDLNSAEFDIDSLIKTVPDHVKVVTLAACQVINSEYADSYLASLFKNQTKCQSLAEEIPYRISKTEASPGEDEDLFSAALRPAGPETLS
jgi:hypothetical protein